MSNKSNGTAFEREFAQLLSDDGFWVHRMQDNHNGQPFDVIAAKDGNTLVFDCKDCQNDFFPLRRMEENQRNAMELWKERGNADGWFAVRYSDSLIYLFPYWQLKQLEQQGIKQIRKGNAKFYGISFSVWMEGK